LCCYGLCLVVFWALVLPTIGIASLTNSTVDSFSSLTQSTCSLTHTYSVHEWSGQCNKNLGNAFVLVWRIGDEHQLAKHLKGELLLLYDLNCSMCVVYATCCMYLAIRHSPASVYRASCVVCVSFYLLHIANASA